MFHKITEIIPLPGMKLKASFANGEVRLYDVGPLENKWPVFKSFSAIPGLFELVRVDTGGYGVVWNDELDLASEEIWQNGKPLDYAEWRTSLNEENISQKEPRRRTMDDIQSKNL